MIYAFTAPILRLDGKIQWKVVYFPHSALECFGNRGNIPVKITADGYPFDHMLLPSKNGHYLVFNEFIRRATGKDLGDTLTVTLEKDENPRAFTLPTDIESRLREAGHLEAFLRQPDYFKREQINKIELAKRPDTRENRIIALLATLGGEVNRR